jgi:predicted oxidoreductase
MCIRDRLKQSGKVNYFGVSNFKATQIQYLQNSLDHTLQVNQLQFSLAHTGLIDSGLNANLRNANSSSHDGDVLDYCRQHSISVQAWSPLQFGFFEGNFIDHPNFPKLNQCLARLGEHYHCTPAALALAWILRHPACMQVITGSTKITRVQQLSLASDLLLSREHWYQLYQAAGNALP